jgi:Lamin Tail Domain/PKD domain
MNYRTPIAACLFFTLPGVLRAEVLVHEVAWMGTSANANAEWIELYNTESAAVTLEGWTLSAVDGQPVIPLAGTIHAQGYLVLERTSDDTVPGVSAGVLYTGAMGNTGEVFELKNAAGVVVDRVDGSGDWGIGGDNTEKLTLQRAGSGWITAAATPGAANASQGVAPQAESTPGATDAGTKSTKKPVMTGAGSQGAHASVARTVTAPLEPALTITLGEALTVGAGVRHQFIAEVRKEGGKPITLNTLVWNFGDGTTGEGMRVTHTYPYPGEYRVQVRGTRSTFRPPITAEATLVVQVIPLHLEVSHADRDSIEVHNIRKDEVDISQFALAVGKKHFRIPSGTVLLQGARVRFASRTTGLTPTSQTDVAIFTPDGTRVSPVFSDAEEQGVDEEQELVLEEVSEDSDDVRTYVASELDAEEEISVTEGERTAAIASPLLAAQVAAASDTTEPAMVPLWWWLVGLAALAGMTGGVIVFARRERAEIIEGYLIESEDE